MWYNSLMNIITSKSNNGIKKVKKLHQKKYRIDSYLIEGWHLYEEAINHQAPIEQVFVLEEFVDKIKKDTKVTIVSPVSYTHLDVYKRQALYRWIRS